MLTPVYYRSLRGLGLGLGLGLGGGVSSLVSIFLQCFLTLGFETGFRILSPGFEPLVADGAVAAHHLSRTQKQ